MYTAVALGSARYAFGAESRLKRTGIADPVAHLIFRGAARLANSSTASAAHTSEVKNLNQNDHHLVQVRRSMRSIFAGPPQQCKFQLYFYFMSPSSTFVVERVGNF
jgi:hypothetical protein